MNLTGRLFLTGGTGFFGKNLLEFVIGNGCPAEITILSRDPEKFRREFPLYSRLNIRFIQGDILDFPLPAESFDYIIHGATPADARMIAEQPDLIYRTITDGTRRILELAERSPSARFLYISSGAVYGPQPPDLPGFPEDWIGIPENAYGKGKLTAEKMCREALPKCVIARCFAFSGRYLPLEKHFAVGNFVSDVLHDRDIVIRGDGRTVRSYLDARDLAEWLFKLLTGDFCGVYNVGSDHAVTIRELAETVLHVSGKNLGLRILGKPDPNPPHRYLPDISKAKKAGLLQTVPLEESLKKMLNQERLP